MAPGLVHYQVTYFRKKCLELKDFFFNFFLDMTNIVLLLVIIMLVFSVIGITLFRDVMPEQFGDLSTGKTQYLSIHLVREII